MKFLKNSIFLSMIIWPALVILTITGIGCSSDIEPLKGNLARVEMKISRTGKDFVPICYGVFVSPEYVLITRHFIDLAGQFLVNGVPARIQYVWDDLDLLLLETEANPKFIKIKTGNLSIGSPVFTLAERNGFIYWVNAGTIKEIFFERIILSDFCAESGESGKPVFTQTGEFVGIIQASWEFSETHLIPANRCFQKD